MLLLHRIIERDCVAGMAALPGGMVDAGDLLVSPDGHLTAHRRPDHSMLAARTAHSNGVPPCPM